MMGALALGYMALFAVVCLGLGWPLVVRLDRGGRLLGAEQTAIAFCFGIIITAIAVFFVGRLRLDAVSMGGVSVAALILSLPGLIGIPWRQARLSMKEIWVSARDNWVEAALWVVLILVSASALVQGMAPPNDYDSLMYHLASPKMDVEQGVIGHNWDRGLPHMFFAELTADLARLMLATIGDRPVQMLGGLYAMAASLGTAALVRRMGFGRWEALLAALLFVVCRAVVWETATAEVEVPLATFTILALCTLLAWRDHDEAGLLIACGLLLGGGLLVKFHGAAIGLAMGLPMLLRRPFRPGVIGLAACAAVALYIPHTVEMTVLTGNPLYPMLNQIFTPGGMEYFSELRGQYGIGRGLFSVLPALWTLSVNPMQYFDGMMLGTPYFLALAPLAIFARSRLRHNGTVLLVAGLYYLAWFYLLSQQVRFLIPIFPILAAYSAIGVSAVWAYSASFKAGRVALGGILGALALNQAMFVGIYAALRLPVAVGMVSPELYHSKTPTMTGAFYSVCKWVGAHTAPDEQIMSLLIPHSYYCPQAAATLHNFRDEGQSWFLTGESPPMARDEFVRRFHNAKFRWVIVQANYESRGNDTGIAELKSANLHSDRFGTHLVPALEKLQPVITDAYAAVYDGHDVLKALEAAR